MHRPEYWLKATKFLSQKDPVLKKIIANYKGEFLASRGNSFETLARSIVGQQISVKAADSVWKKFISEVPNLNPENILKVKTSVLRSCGLSERKVFYIKDLALHFKNKTINPHEFHSLTDEDIISCLVSVKGIGRWTAEMFLMFHLLRPNIFPVADIGLHRAISKNYNKKYPLAKKWLSYYQKQWAPWNTVAVWYLWRSLDPIPVEY